MMTGGRTDRARSVLRVVIGLCLLDIWAQAGLPAAWDSWRTAMYTPSASNISYDEQRATLPQGSLNVLIAATRDNCLATPPTIILSDDVVSWFQGNYLLYPRPLDVIQSVDGFTSADFDTHTGGCLFTYGPERDRLQPFLTRLAPIKCAEGDCLYRILDARAPSR